MGTPELMVLNTISPNRIRLEEDDVYLEFFGGQDLLDALIDTSD